MRCLGMERSWKGEAVGEAVGDGSSWGLFGGCSCGKRQGGVAKG